MTAPQTRKENLLYPATAVGLSAAVAYVTGVLKIAMSLIGFGLKREETEKRLEFTNYARRNLEDVQNGSDEGTLRIGHTIGMGIVLVSKVEARMADFFGSAINRFQQKLIEIREVDEATIDAAMAKIEEAMEDFKTALALDIGAAQGLGRVEVLEKKAVAYNAVRQLLTNVESDARTARFQADKARNRTERILPATKSALQCLAELDNLAEISV